jgi:hypothetical protein
MVINLPPQPPSLAVVAIALATFTPLNTTDPTVKVLLVECQLSLIVVVIDVSQVIAT